MRILVLGGAGFLGSALVVELRKRNHDVTVTSRRDTWSMPTEQTIAWDATEQWLGSTPPVDAIVHLVGPNGDELSDADPSLSSAKTKNVIDLCRRVPQCSLLYFSTFQVFGRWSGIVTDETIPNPRSAYAVSHMQNESLVREFGESQHRPVLVLRPTNIYGVSPNQSAIRWHRVPADFCRQAVTRREIVIKGSPGDFRDFLPVSVLARRVADLLSYREQWDGSCRIVGSGIGVSLSLMAHKVARAAHAVLGGEVSVQTELSIPSTERMLEVTGRRWQNLTLVSSTGVDFDAPIQELLRVSLGSS